MTEPAEDRVAVTYAFDAEDREEAQRRARAFALEQTVELPEGAFPARLEAEVVARVEGGVRRLAPNRYAATLSFDAELVTPGVPQFLNIVFGNVSLQRGVVLEDFVLPDAVLRAFPGPRAGLVGIRDAIGVQRRPLVCTTAKPVGLSSQELADLCAEFAAAGVDLIKDDHGVMSPRAAPFEERVKRCQEAVAEANARTGGRSLYFPNITGPTDSLDERVRVVLDAGCRGALVNPFVMGLDMLRRLATAGDLMLMVHPTHSGAVSDPVHGIAPPVLLGKLLRLFGADAVIFIAYGGRFAVSAADGEGIVRNLRDAWGSLLPALPVAGGGVTVESVPRLVERLGRDVMFLVGSDLYAHADRAAAARELMESVARYGDG